MGLKSAKEEGLSFLGISARKVEFREGGIKPKTLAKSTISNKSCPIISKKSIKNYFGLPSSLGLFDLENPFNTDSISFIVTNDLPKRPHQNLKNWEVSE